MANDRNEAKHTPGPWRVVERERDDNAAYSIESESGIIVANVISGLGLETEAANARLIAAAPDLLAALHALLDRIDHHFGDTHRYGQGNEWREQEDARAAIAKAGGREG